MKTELQEFLGKWEHETDGTLALMRALPPDQYDLRPDTGGRSLGELAWHLAEVDAYMSTAIEQGEFKFDVKPPHIERPKTVEALAPAFRLVHEEAAARVAGSKRPTWTGRSDTRTGHSGAFAIFFGASCCCTAFTTAVN